jgi:hypothetical protein
LFDPVISVVVTSPSPVSFWDPAPACGAGPEFD